MNMLGKAKSVKVTKDTTVIVGGGSRKEIEDRVRTLRSQAADQPISTRRKRRSGRRCDCE